MQHWHGAWHGLEASCGATSQYSRLCLNPCPLVDTQSHGFSWSMGSKRGPQAEWANRWTPKAMGYGFPRRWVKVESTVVILDF